MAAFASPWRGQACQLPRKRILSKKKKVKRSRVLGSPHFPACHRHSPPEEVNKSGIRASASGALLQRG